jgi:hypothetical protein
MCAPVEKGRAADASRRIAFQQGPLFPTCIMLYIHTKQSPQVHALYAVYIYTKQSHKCMLYIQCIYTQASLHKCFITCNVTRLIYGKQRLCRWPCFRFPDGSCLYVYSMFQPFCHSQGKSSTRTPLRRTRYLWMWVESCCYPFASCLAACTRQRQCWRFLWQHLSKKVCVCMCVLWQHLGKRVCVFVCYDSTWTRRCVCLCAMTAPGQEGVCVCLCA